MNAFETKLKTLLDEQVDAELGPRRCAPAFAETHAAGAADPSGVMRDRSRRLLPLLAAAAVAALGILLGTVLSGATSHQPATSHTPAPPRPTPTSSTPPSPAPTSAATATPKPGVHAVDLAGAQVALPQGWRATDIVGSDGESDLLHGWCLDPRAQPNPTNCAIEFVEIRTPQPNNGVYLDFDAVHWGFGNAPEECNGNLVHHEQFGARALGSRPAEWRMWRWDCANGQRVYIEQYVTTTAPVYALWAYHTGRPVHTAMARIARDSSLPGQAAPLRLADRGIVRGISRGTDGVTVTLDRLVHTWRNDKDVVVREGSGSVSYLVPPQLFDSAKVAVGSTVDLQTDGRTVFAFGAYG